MVIEKNFTIADADITVQPTASKPFRVEVMEGQPVGLTTFQQIAPHPTPSAAIVMTSSRTPPLEALARVVQNAAASPAAGLIITDPAMRVLAVLDMNEVRRGPFKVSVMRLSAALEAGYEPLPGAVEDIGVLVYGCPVDPCPIPLVYVFHKGQPVPPCPLHKVPRVLKGSQEG
jgi:hypothetical protein